MSDLNDHQVKATALRLLLAQIDRNAVAVDSVHSEIESQLSERPDRMSQVLASLLGIAAAEIMHRHNDDREAAARSIEAALVKALDDAQASDD